MYNALLQEIKTYKSVVLGFSGGVDSSLLAYALREANINYVCITVQTPFLSEKEFAHSYLFCKQHNIRHECIYYDTLANKTICANSKNRCYHCKKAIFGLLKGYADKNGYDVVMDGSNADDCKEYRPGLKAKEELQVVSPLEHLGISKSAVREMSKSLGLDTWNRESATCLATRVPYNTALNGKTLRAVDEAESLLATKGIKGLRVRVHGDIARIESDNPKTLVDALDKETTEKIKRLGFKYVCVDAEGYKRGCYD